MLLLIAAGVIALEQPTGIGTIIARPSQTAAIQIGSNSAVASAPIPNGAAVFGEPFDPSDRAPRAWDFTAQLADGETIVEIVRLTMMAAGAAVGVQIDSGGGRDPIIGTSGKVIQLWFKVNDAHQADAAFLGDGMSVGVAALVRTSSTPSRQYERTAVLTVRQQ